jgi:hypothetical protein
MKSLENRHRQSNARGSVITHSRGSVITHSRGRPGWHAQASSTIDIYVLSKRYGVDAQTLQSSMERVALLAARQIAGCQRRSVDLTGTREIARVSKTWCHDRADPGFVFGSRD